MPPLKFLLRVTLAVCALVVCHLLWPGLFTWWLPFCFVIGSIAGYYYSNFISKP